GSDGAAHRVCGEGRSRRAAAAARGRSARRERSRRHRLGRSTRHAPRSLGRRDPARHAQHAAAMKSEDIMPPTFKQLTEFFKTVGADQVAHTEKTYLAHAIGVYQDLKSWGADEDLCRAGMFHSIYGTEKFQRFAL